MSEQRQALKSEEGNAYKGFPWTHPILQHHIVYIGGLALGTKIRTIRNYISHFGKIIWIKIMSNRTGPEQAGYCHLILSHPSEYQALFETAVHEIANVQVRIKMWKQAAGSASYEDKLNRRKLFVKNLSLKQTSDKLAAFFSRFGSVEKIDLAPNNPRKQHQRFCFVIFKDSASVQRCLEQKYFIFKETNMRCRSYAGEKEQTLQSAHCDDPLQQPVLLQHQDCGARGEPGGAIALGSLPREVKNHRKHIKGGRYRARQKQSLEESVHLGDEYPNDFGAAEEQGRNRCATSLRGESWEPISSGSLRTASPPVRPAFVNVIHVSMNQIEHTAPGTPAPSGRMRLFGVHVRYYTIIGGI